jgi:hypothetical protein
LTQAWFRNSAFGVADLNLKAPLPIAPEGSITHRMPEFVQVLAKEKAPICGAFAKAL